MLKWLKKNISLKNVGKVLKAVTGGGSSAPPVRFQPSAGVEPWGVTPPYVEPERPPYLVTTPSVNSPPPTITRPAAPISTVQDRESGAYVATATQEQEQQKIIIMIAIGAIVLLLLVRR